MARKAAKIIITSLAGLTAVGLSLTAAGPAQAQQSWVYSGSCGSGCYKYTNGSSTTYTGRWQGLTTNQLQPDTRQL